MVGSEVGEDVLLDEKVRLSRYFKEMLAHSLGLELNLLYHETTLLVL